MTARHWMVIGALLSVGVVGASLYDPSHAPPTSDAPAETATDAPHGDAPPMASPPVAGPTELALVAPLAPGADLAGWTVQSIEGVQGGAMTVVVTRADVETRLQVALDDPRGANPPARVGRYAVYFGPSHDSGEGQTLALALQAVIARHPDVEPPAGLGPLVAQPREGT